MDRKKRTFQRWSALEGGQCPPSKTRSHYEHIKKPQGAILSLHGSPPVREQFFAPYTPRVTSTAALFRLFIPRSCGHRRPAMKPSLSCPPFFWLSCLSCFSFSRESLTPPALPSSPPLHAQTRGEKGSSGARSINARFLRDWFDCEGSRAAI